MQTLTVQEAQSHLTEIIERMAPGEEITLTHDDKPVAIIRAARPQARKHRQLGTLKGSVLYMAPDFDAIPEGFEESRYSLLMQRSIPMELRAFGS
jgi:antitoxin (DNA-binding transcriptional repressor) of toxin-antitoxin stability system